MGTREVKKKKKDQASAMPTMLWHYVRTQEMNIKTNRIKQFGNGLLPPFAC